MESIIETLGKINFAKPPHNNTNQFNNSSVRLYTDNSNVKDGTSRFVPHSARETRETIQDRIPEVPKYEGRKCDSTLDHNFQSAAERPSKIRKSKSPEY